MERFSPHRRHGGSRVARARAAHNHVVRLPQPRRLDRILRVATQHHDRRRLRRARAHRRLRARSLRPVGPAQSGRGRAELVRPARRRAGQLGRAGVRAAQLGDVLRPCQAGSLLVNAGRAAPARARLCAVAAHGQDDQLLRRPAPRGLRGGADHLSGRAARRHRHLRVLPAAAQGRRRGQSGMRRPGVLRRRQPGADGLRVVRLRVRPLRGERAQHALDRARLRRRPRCARLDRAQRLCAGGLRGRGRLVWARQQSVLPRPERAVDAQPHLRRRRHGRRRERHGHPATQPLQPAGLRLGRGLHHQHAAPLRRRHPLRRRRGRLLVLVVVHDDALAGPRPPRHAHDAQGGLDFGGAHLPARRYVRGALRGHAAAGRRPRGGRLRRGGVGGRRPGLRPSRTRCSTPSALRARCITEIADLRAL